MAKYTVDDYIREVVQRGDEGSELLARFAVTTLENSRFVDVVEQEDRRFAVLRIPSRYYVIVHSASGDPSEKDISRHSASLVDRLVEQARAIEAEPVGFANVIDSNSGDTDMLESIVTALVNQANRYNLAIMNGENAISGARVNPDIQANVSGTMISIIDKEKMKYWHMIGYNRLDRKNHYAFRSSGISYGVFSSGRKPVFINSDGVGTKIEFYERAREHHLAVDDFFAMNLDDAVKFGAEAKIISGVVETRGRIHFGDIDYHASKLAEEMGVVAIMQHEEVGDRLQGYAVGRAAYNISGSVVSVIDEKRLREPLKPGEGDRLVAIRGRANPRSNGITSKRETMIRLFGENWHEIREGKLFLEYLASPSTILYPVFRELVKRRLVNGVFHMSGGAYNGKLARPLAKQGLFVKIRGLFPPDWRELALAGANFTSASDAYAKWPMGNDGFVATSHPRAVTNTLNRYDLHGKVVGQLEKSVRGGVELEAYNGKGVYFNGKD